MPKVVAITPDREISVEEVSEPLFESIGKLVDGWIEMVRPKNLKPEFVMIVNEEGLLRNLKFNPIGSLFYGGTIVGNIVLLKEDYVEGELDLVGLSDTEIPEIVTDLIDLGAVIK